MNRILFVLTFCCCISARGQLFQESLLYFDSSYSFGNFQGVNIDLNYAPNRKMSYGLGYRSIFGDADNLPSDFINNSGNSVFSRGQEFQWSNIFYVKVGRLVPLNEKQTIRLNLQLGLGASNTEYPLNFQPINEQDFAGPNYTFETDRRNSLAIIFNPTLEFPFTKVFGLSVSPVLMYQDNQFFAGIGFASLIGYLRK